MHHLDLDATFEAYHAAPYFELAQRAERLCEALLEALERRQDVVPTLRAVSATLHWSHHYRQHSWRIIERVAPKLLPMCLYDIQDHLPDELKLPFAVLIAR